MLLPLLCPLRPVRFFVRACVPWLMPLLFHLLLSVRSFCVLAHWFWNGACFPIAVSSTAALFPVFSPVCTLVTSPLAPDGKSFLVPSSAVSSSLPVSSPADVAAAAGFPFAQSAVSPPAVLH